jgi:hypothetical protein
MHVHNLCLILLAFDWNYALHNGPARIVALAAAIAPTLQLLKRAIPGLGGWKAVATNIFFSVVGVIALTSPDQLLSVNFFANIIVTAIGAAGIHGTAKLAGSQDDASALIASPGPSIASKTPMLILVLGLSFAMAGLSGCTDWERGTYQTLKASKTVIDTAQADYEARTIPRTQAAYTIINEAKAAQTLAVQQMETYEEIKFAKANPGALSAQQAAVNAALAQLPALLKAVEGVYQHKPPAPAPPIAKPAAVIFRPGLALAA